MNFEVDQAVPAACFDPGDVPSGRSDWLPLIATGTDAAGRWVEVTLHVTSGYLGELEIWTGKEGEVAEPVVDSLELEERVSARMSQAIARALIERLEPELPAGIALEPTWLGGIDVRRAGLPAESASGFGGIAATAQSLLSSVGWKLDEHTDYTWLPCAHPDVECACADGGAALEGDELRLWFGEAERPTRTFAPVSRDELTRLATLWSEP
ncbi:hypothetical protein OM076_18875 [Solirubrobacter ginsenosidimutans]|uniref:Uncharacterized protein n=1 Tax=Solirubrobacter ginsenosidimutans TaxID=490573 RepID=A0A9X3S648_9ACTN|nr:hypothetical protein [Solirubrobacter ginsenosidimutans]MDA0162343.1 hypothetical protein [Solirubrobacter ginsenosidimutans]